MTAPRQIAPPTNALALAGLILGVVAAVIGLLTPSATLMLLLAFIPGLLAIIFGFIGIYMANRMGGLRRKHAIWAVVLGFTPVVVWLVAGWLLAAVFGISRVSS
ncbi:hypothetical protein [Homoserinimonas sp. A520]